MAARPREGCVAGGGREVSAIGAEAEFRGTSAAGAGKDLNHAGHGIGAVECALCAAEKLHAVGFGERKRAEVESSSGLVDGDAIDHHFVVIGLATAHEKGRQASALAGGIHHGAREKADSIVSGCGLHGFELPAFQSGNVGTGFFGECWSSGRGHHNGLRRWGEMQMDGDDIGMGGDVFGLGRKTRSQDLNLIIA